MNPPSFDNPFTSDRLDTAANFRPEWDVTTAGGRISASLDSDIIAVRSNPKPGPARKIQLLLGAVGYGKTHLFGRVAHRHGDKVLLLFVPFAKDASSALANVQWSVVETLFEPATGGAALLSVLMSRLLQPSFAAYFRQLPSPNAAHAVLANRLQTDWAAVPEVMAPVMELGPYHALADSLANRLPSLQSDVLRALILGLSPAAPEARTWLRGEPLPPERLDALRLGETGPAAASVLTALSVLLQRLQTPVLLCLDQLDLLLRNKDQFGELTTALMGWLQEVPNLLIVIGCMKDEWEQVGAQFESFVDRVKAHRLEPLTPAEAVELVCQRLRSCEGRRPDQPSGWPFDLASVEKFARSNPLPPRGFIKTCASRFDKWLASKSKGLIELLPSNGPKRSLAELFVQEWERQLEVVRSTAKAAVNYQEEELWQGIHEALQIAYRGKITPEGVAFPLLEESALRQTPADKRPSAVARLAVGPKAFNVVVAVSKKDAGPAFAAYVKALEEILETTGVAGAVIIWPKKLSVKPTADAYQRYQKAVNAGKVRPFALDADDLTFHQLECLRQVLRLAETKELQLDGKTLSTEDCRKLILETKLLHNLKLFNIVFEGWPAVEAARAKAPALAAATHQAAAVGASAAPKPPPPPEPVPAAKPLAIGTRTPKQPPAAAAVAGATKADAWAADLLARVVEKLRNWGQPVAPLGVEMGPTFVRLKVSPRDQTDIDKVRKKAENLKLHLSLEARPLIDTHGGYITIDVQRPDRQTVKLSDVLAKRPASLNGQPAFPVGVDVSGKAHWLNLADPSSCHVLIAGTTGSGKSAFMKAMLAALANELGPDQLQFVLIDPKQVTFNLPGESPYLRHEVAHDVDDALPLIEDCFDEMERRYALLKQRHKENVSELTGADAVPRRVLVFDEFADLMLDRGSKKELETLLKRLGAKARAAGIHLVLGTQRTEASVVTPLLRSNLPGRISLRVAGERDSKLILEAPDAAHLLGGGDLFWREGGGLLRLQGPFVDKESLETALRMI